MHTIRVNLAKVGTDPTTDPAVDYTTADKETSLGPATRVLDYRPQRTWVSTDETGVLSVKAGPFVSGIHIENTNAETIEIEVWTDPQPPDPNFPLVPSDIPPTLIWGPVTFDLTGITDLEAFMRGEADYDYGLFAPFCTANMSAVPDFEYGPDGELALGPDGEPFFLSYREIPSLITEDVLINITFSTSTEKSPVYCGVVYPGEIKETANPVRGMIDEYDFGAYEADDLNSGTPFIEEPMRVPRQVSGTIDTSTEILVKSYREFIRKVAGRPFPVRIVRDGTTAWDMYARFITSPKMTYDGTYNSKQTFTLKEVI